MKCPFCNAPLLYSEERGPHCDGCDQFDEALADHPRLPNLEKEIDDGFKDWWADWKDVFANEIQAKHIFVVAFLTGFHTCEQMLKKRAEVKPEAVVAISPCCNRVVYATSNAPGMIDLKVKLEIAALVISGHQIEHWTAEEVRAGEWGCTCKKVQGELL